ncbi:MAG: hypothetical protein AAB897_01110 [Patescibacteria group bacterium]
MNGTENISRIFPTIGLIVFAGALLFFAVISLILNYHWRKHGVGLAGLSRAKIFYFGVSGILLVAMATLLFLINQ